MRAYVVYVIQSFGSLEEREPGSLASYRPFLLRAFPVLKQYAPDLMSSFVLLEQRSRGSQATSNLEMEAGEILNKIEQNRTRSIGESDPPNERAINELISRGDFNKARKLIDKLPEDSQRLQLNELVNAKEALYLLKEDKFVDAQRLAEKLKRASSIREVYPALIAKCVGSNDEVCATSLMIQAMKQLKASDVTPANLPSGMPASVVPGKREVDPILDGMAKLTLAVLPISHDIAMVGLVEIVAAANASEVDTSQGIAGFDVSIFKKLATKDEKRVRQSAESFTNIFRRLLSLATIDQSKAADLEERYKRLTSMKEGPRRTN